MSGVRERKVACEGDDGLLRIHREAETCEVCRGVVELATVRVEGCLSDDIINALDSLSDAADDLRATGSPAMSKRVSGAAQVLRTAVFAPQPPAEAQAPGGGEVCPHCKGNPGLDCNSFGRTAPSAPVGVDILRRTEAALSRHFDNTCDGSEVKVALEARAFLAQQPAAVDGAVTAKMVREALHFCPSHLGSGPSKWRWMAARINAALAQQPAAVNGAMSPQVAREWLLELMGDYDFTLPSDAFSAIVDALAQP